MVLARSKAAAYKFTGRYKVEGRDEFVGLDLRVPNKSRGRLRTEGRFMSTYVIKLYVTGQTPRSRRAIENLRRLCDEDLQGRYDLVVIDVLERPQIEQFSTG